jgi:hypothetical protein
MKQIIILLTFLFAFATADAQSVFAGTLKVSNFGDFYRIEVAQMPYKTSYPIPDSITVRVTVLCLESMTCEVTHIPVNGHLDYKMSGTHYIYGAATFWKKGKRSHAFMPTLCGFFLNPIYCYQKI